MSIFSLTCPDVGCYQNFQCDPEFQNKIVAVAYVRKSDALTAQEKSTADNWIAALYDRYLNGEAYLVFNTSGEKPKPETATTAGRGMQNTKALAKTHTLTYQDMQVTQNNIQFYNDILGSAQNFDFYYFTPQRIWDASGYYVTVMSSLPAACSIDHTCSGAPEIAPMFSTAEKVTVCGSVQALVMVLPT